MLLWFVSESVDSGVAQIRVKGFCRAGALQCGGRAVELVLPLCSAQCIDSSIR